MTIELRRVRVCATHDIPSGEGRALRIADRPVAVFRVADAFHVLDNTCTHMGGPLADGLVADATVACPLHERRFALDTGQAVGHDCGAVAAYPVTVEGDDVWVTIPVMQGAAGRATVAAPFSADTVTRDAVGEDAVEREVPDDAGLLSHSGTP